MNVSHKTITLATALVFSCGVGASGSPGDGKGESTLRIDPLLIAQASEVWSVIATDDNKVWPGWNATDTVTPALTG